MAEFTPTAAQKSAIETTGCSILVSAGAGSGKTKVLTERLMRYVLNRDDPEKRENIDRFVIITFTQAAAGELRSRITEELLKAAAEAEKDPTADAEFKRHVRRQQALIAKAQIGTIHHFCLSLLRENSHHPALGLSPDFRILSDERSIALKSETLSDLLDSRYERMTEFPGFEELVNSVGVGRDDSALSELVLQLYEKMQCHAFPEKWAATRIAGLDSDLGDIGETMWGKELLTYAKSRTDFWAADMDRLIGLAAKDSQLSGKCLDNLSESAAGIREFSRCLGLGWEKAAACPPPEFSRLVFPRNAEDPEIVERIKSRRSECKEAMKKLKSLFTSDSETLKAEMRRTAPAMKALLSLTIDFQTAFADAKFKAGAADYSDLEHKAAALLLRDDDTPSDYARSISSRYREIMIDEYQDVSRVQDAIFRAVSDNGNNLFMVGDVKQSIYRFRLADSEIFNEKYRSFARLEDAGKGEPRKILLRENFRSRREILDCANSVFSCCMSRSLGDVDYDSDAALICGSEAYEGTVPVPELAVVTCESGNAVLREAEYTAEAIEKLVLSGTPVTGKNGPRPVEYGDIAILLRTANSTGGIYRRELLKRGIPVITGQGGGFFDTREASLLFSLLKVMDNPHRDAELVSVLSSPLYGFTADDLALIRAQSRDTDIWSALNIAADAPELTELFRGRISGFISQLNHFRSKAPDLSADGIVRMLLSETQMELLFSAMPDGEQRASNAERFLVLGSKFEEDGNHGLHRFVQHLIRMSEKDAEIPSVTSGISAVQILSIHKSKGLEYPVVFLCGTAHRFNLQETTDTVLVHPVLGLGPVMVDRERMFRCPTLPRRAIALRAKQEAVSEEMRLLYVAMTRPKEYLFLTATVKDPEKTVEAWKTKISAGTGAPDPEILADADCFLSWLLAAAFSDGQKHLTVKTVNSSDSLPEQRKDGTQLPAEDLSAPPEDRTVEDGEDPELSDIRRKLEYVYPYEDSTRLPSKVTATELKHFSGNSFEEQNDSESVSLFMLQDRAFPTAQDGEDTENAALSPPILRNYRKPEFLREEKPLTGAEKGIATHMALQYMQFEKGLTGSGVQSELDRLTAAGFLSQRQKEAVNTDAIVKLFTSPLGSRLLKADRITREFRFSLLCNAEDILGEGGKEKILLQGVVDCCMEENGELVIVDYKTDMIRSESELNEKVLLYSGQIRAYAMALHRIFRKPVKETVLYFLSVGKAITVPADK